MSTRNFDETGIHGTYILDDELTLPTPLDPNKKYIVKVISTLFFVSLYIKDN